MMKATNLIFSLVVVVAIAGCKSNSSDFDATGTFESNETIVSSEVAGLMIQYNIEEGKFIKKGEVIGYVDTTQLFLKKKQVITQINSVASRFPKIEDLTSYYNKQIEANDIRLKYLQQEELRLRNLYAGDAATKKQMDEIESQVAEMKKQKEVLQKQMNAQTTSLQTQLSGLQSDIKPLAVQVEQLNDQIKRSVIKSPLSGVILGSYLREGEVVSVGMPVAKIANLNNLTLRVYVSSSQLSQIKLNQTVKVFIDSEDGAYKEFGGRVTWISEKAEFTPKNVQTKEVRSNMVYAVKVGVVNDGSIKIGMYGQIKI